MPSPASATWGGDPTRLPGGHLPALMPPGSTTPPRLLRVLCVDDQPDGADSLAEVLGLLGYEARACYDGPAALEAAREFRPDVCLLDLDMPGMDGLELAARLRAEAGGRPMLLAATTALDAPHEQGLTALAGFHEHLIKPIEPGALQKVLERFRGALRRHA